MPAALDRYRIVGTFFAIAGLLAVAACSNTDLPGTGGEQADATDQWTMLGQNFSSTYANPGEKTLSPKNVSGLKSAWCYQARGTVTSASAVKDGIVYVVSSGSTTAHRTSDGSILWENTDVAGTSSPTLSDGALYIDDVNSVLHKLDAATGVERWKSVIDPNQFASGFSSPIVFEHFVIVGSSSNEEAATGANATFRGSVVAFDRDTGAELWRFYTADPPFNGASVWSSQSIDPDLRLVFASTGNNYTEQAGPTSDSIFALDIDTGAVRWLTQLTKGDIFTILNPQSPDTDFGTNPILFTAEIAGQKRKLVGAGQKSGVFWALDRETGAVVWSRAVSPGSALIGGMLNNGAFDGQHLLVAGVSCGDGSGKLTKGVCDLAHTTALLAALNPSDGTSVWERTLPSWVWAPITVANGVGYVGVDNVLQAFDVSNGDLLFSFTTGGTIASAATISDGRVHFGSGLSYFVGTPDRTMHVLSLDGSGATECGSGQTFAPTFTAIYNEIIVGQGCNTTSCHGGNQGNLSMTTQAEAYTNLVNVRASGVSCGSSGLIRVVPNNPDASLLLDKVSHNPPICGGPMPPSTPLGDRELAQIRDWIANGAPND